MKKPTKKQIAITADLMGRTLHQLDELGIPYVVLLDDIPKMFTNTASLHAAAIVEEQYLLNAKIQEYRIENQADKQTAIPPAPEDGHAAA
jgi:alpha-D-ribose 1-methylphosphonate 5-phosphate C-P lyase